MRYLLLVIPVALGARATCAHTSRRSFKMLDSGGANWEQTAVLRPSNAREADGSQCALRPKPPAGAALRHPLRRLGQPCSHCSPIQSMSRALVRGTAPEVDHSPLEAAQRCCGPVGMGCGGRFGTHISVSKERSEWRLLIGAPM